jgi:alkylhydroperoxidase/carboxymuconolactone decarboxylase family protein YurZ
LSECERRLLSLAVNDDDALASLVRSPLDADRLVGLDAKMRTLVCLGAVIVSGASAVTYQWATQVALDAGAADDEIVGP